MPKDDLLRERNRDIEEWEDEESLVWGDEDEWEEEWIEGREEEEGEEEIPKFEEWFQLVSNDEFDALEGEMEELVPHEVKANVSVLGTLLARDITDAERLAEVGRKVVERIIAVATGERGKDVGWSEKHLENTLYGFVAHLTNAAMEEGTIDEDRVEEFVRSLLQPVEDTALVEDVVQRVSTEFLPREISEYVLDLPGMNGAEFAQWLEKTLEKYTPPSEVVAVDENLVEKVRGKMRRLISYLLNNEDVNVKIEFVPIRRLLTAMAEKMESEEEMTDEEMKEEIKEGLFSAYAYLLVKGVFRGLRGSVEEEEDRVRKFAERLKLWLKRLHRTKELRAEGGAEEEEDVATQPPTPEAVEETPEEVEGESEVEEATEEERSLAVEKVPRVFLESVLRGMVQALEDSRWEIEEEEDADELVRRLNEIKKEVVECGRAVGIDVAAFPAQVVLPKLRKLFVKAIEKALKSFRLR